jgi:hypothetical protein
MPLTDRAYVAKPGEAPTGLYQAAARWITVVGAEGSDAEGFVATIRANPSNGVIRTISQPGSLWDDVGPFLAPLIRAWNATTEEVTFRDVPEEVSEDGTVTRPARTVVDAIETVPLPAPAEGDWTVLLKLDPPLREWVLEQCILARFHVLAENAENQKGPNGKNAPAPSGSTPDGTPDGETTPTPSKPNRRSPRSSSTPSTSTGA